MTALKRVVSGVSDRLRGFIEILMNRGARPYEFVADTWPADGGGCSGWNQECILRVYERKWPRFVELLRSRSPMGFSHESELEGCSDVHAHNIVMTFAYAVSVASRRAEKLAVLDWGGGPGHYYLYTRSLFPDLLLDYHCSDVPLLTGFGRKVLPEVTFHDGEDCLSRTYDLVVASTSFQYFADWPALLGKLSRSTGRYLYIAQLPVVERSPSFVFLQRPYRFGYDTEYLAWCLNREQFMACAKDQGFTLEHEFIYGYRPVIHRAPEQNEYKGFLFSRK